MADLIRQRALFLAQESAFQDTPGSYVAVPCLELGEVTDGREILVTDYSTGAPFRTPHEVSPGDSWSLSFVTPLIGLPTAAGDGTDASTVSEDWLDFLLSSVFGAGTNTQGEGVDAGSAAATLELAAAAVAADQDVVCVSNATRAQWRMVSDDASDPTLAITPDWSTVPVDADVLYGARRYLMGRGPIGGGHPGTTKYLRGHLVIGGTEYNLRGGYVTSLSISAEVNQIARMSWTLSGVSKVEGSVAVGVDAIASPAVTPIKLQTSSVYHGASQVDTSGIEIDFGLETTAIASSESDQGVLGWQTTGAAPTLNVKPLFTDSWVALKRAGTASLLLAQLGKGDLGASAVNTACLALMDAQATGADPGDENGLRRNQVGFEGADRVSWETGTASRFIQFLRA